MTLDLRIPESLAPPSWQRYAGILGAPRCSPIVVAADEGSKMLDYTIEAITPCAIPGFTALRAWVGPTDEPRTEAGMAEALYVQPVIAWRHVVERQAYAAGEVRAYRRVEPVMPDMDDWGEVADALDALEFPDGRVRIPDEGEFPDRAAFIRYALRRWSETRSADANRTQP